MSEQLHHQPKHEQLRPIEITPDTTKEQLSTSENTVGEKNTERSIDTARQQVESQAISTESFQFAEQTTTPPQQQTYGVQHELKAEAYRRSLRTIRAKLNVPERLFSGVVHNPVLDTTANALGKTIARPWGLLVAGLTMLIGTLIVQYYARKYGFTYNYLLFIAFLCVGYIAGLLLEVGIRLVRRPNE